MKRDVWRLYRYLILGGVLILASCYVVMTFAQLRLVESRFERLLCVDASFSAALLLTQSSDSVEDSRLLWHRKSAEALSLTTASSFIVSKKWLKLPDKSYRLIFGPADNPILIGSVPKESHFFLLESLISSFLLSSKLEQSQKMQFLREMPCISEKNLSYKELDFPLGITWTYKTYGEHGFIWKEAEMENPVYFSLTYDDEFSLTFLVVAVAGTGMFLMLLIIWRELASLDSKRKIFESATRQIARGRSSLPKGIPDRSGTLKELAYSFDAMSSHIQRLLKVQREMINAISHELRTPIARLRFGLEVLKDEVDDTVEKTIEALEGDVEELNTLVDEVLTYGKLESGSLNLNFGESSIASIVNTILQQNRLLLQHLHVKVDISSDDQALIDEHHLSRAIQNLVLNAAKYAASEIVITLTRDDARWQLDIEDDGPGIAFEDRDKVFIPFERLDNSRTRASGGYGLGLAIVQRIAFWHGGAVLIDASESGGAKFSLIWSRNQHQNTLS